MAIDEETLRKAFASIGPAAGPAKDLERLRAAMLHEQYKDRAEVPRSDRRLSTHMIIVAGNQQQAEQHCRCLQISPFDVTVLSSIDRMKGLPEYDVVFVGTWYRRPDIVDVMERLQADVVARKLRGDEQNAYSGSGADTQWPSVATPNMQQQGQTIGNLAAKAAATTLLRP